MNVREREIERKREGSGRGRDREGGTEKYNICMCLGHERGRRHSIFCIEDQKELGNLYPGFFFPPRKYKKERDEKRMSQ